MRVGRNTVSATLFHVVRQTAGHLDRSLLRNDVRTSVQSSRPRWKVTRAESTVARHRCSQTNRLILMRASDSVRSGSFVRSRTWISAPFHVVGVPWSDLTAENLRVIGSEYLTL